MAKGKKFNVAEVYFREKELILKKELREAKKETCLIKEQFNKLLGEYNEVKNENVKLNTELAKLLEYTNLNKDEIKAACQKDIAFANFAKTLTLFSKTL
jgi:predicted nuclease with TOPRIM domain